MTLVSRRDRLLDAGALLLIILGAALYLVAAFKLHAISQYTYKHPGPPHALDAADRARYASYLGVGLVVAGSILGMIAAGLHGWRRKTLVTW
jgi:predicted membrane channel-forming protein YqfA (hemolysin III family)